MDSDLRSEFAVQGILHLRGALGEGESVYCTYADAFETHRITMAMNESVETGQVVPLH